MAGSHRVAQHRSLATTCRDRRRVREKRQQAVHRRALTNFVLGRQGDRAEEISDRGDCQRSRSAKWTWRRGRSRRVTSVLARRREYRKFVRSTWSGREPGADRDYGRRYSVLGLAFGSFGQDLLDEVEGAGIVAEAEPADGLFSHDRILIGFGNADEQRNAFVFRHLR